MSDRLVQTLAFSTRPEQTALVTKMDSYDDRHRAFLQAFMARSTMTFEDAQPVLAAIISAHGRNPMLQSSTVDDMSANMQNRQ